MLSRKMLLHRGRMDQPLPFTQTATNTIFNVRSTTCSRQQYCKTFWVLDHGYILRFRKNGRRVLIQHYAVENLSEDTHSLEITEQTWIESLSVPQTRSYNQYHENSHRVPPFLSTSILYSQASSEVFTSVLASIHTIYPYTLVNPSVFFRNTLYSTNTVH